MPLVPHLRNSPTEDLPRPSLSLAEGPSLPRRRSPGARGFVAAAATAAFVATTIAGPRLASAAPGDELTVSVLTFGPGDHPFFKFGHNAILVHDDVQRADWVYNFGTFGFDSPLLVVDFLKGKLKYWLSVQSLRGTIALYKRENRTIDVQVLNLTAAQKLELKQKLDVNAEDANKYYKYDYYRDNCSTRVRDPVDAITGGAVKAVSVGVPAQMTWRAHTQRLVADSPAFYFALNLAMGDVIDKKVDIWEEMFLPEKLKETLRKAKVEIPCPEGASPSTCGTQPLVKSERRLLEAKRDALRTAPPGGSWTLRCLLVGVLTGSVFAFLGDRGRTSRGARIAFGSLVAAFGGLCGLLGCIFLMFWTLTDHEVAWHNENLLQCAPWLIVLLGSGIGVARGKEASTDRAKKLLTAGAVAAFLGLLLKVLPMFDQDNAQIMAFTIPLWAGAALGIHRMTSGSTTPLTPALIPVPVQEKAKSIAPPPKDDEDEEPFKDDEEEKKPERPLSIPAPAPSEDDAEKDPNGGSEPVPA